MIDLSNIFSKTDQLPSNVDDRVLIIDGTNLWIRIWAAGFPITETGEHVGATLGFLRSIGMNIREFNPTRCIVVFDGKGGSSHRKKVYAEYKANRSSKTSMRRDIFVTPEDEEKSKRSQILRAAQYLTLLPIQLFCIDHVEADDVVAFITANYYDKTENKIRIVSTDRDFLQLVSDKVEVYSPTKKKLYTPLEIKNELGLHPSNYLTYRVLTGDDSDNIGGIPGIGLKTLLKSFPEITEKVVDLDYLYTRSQEIVETEKKPKQVFKNIVAGREIADRNYDLMQLHDTDISSSTKIQIIDLLRSPINKMNRTAFNRFIREDGLIDSFKNLDHWLNSTFNSLVVWSTQ